MNLSVIKNYCKVKILKPRSLQKVEWVLSGIESASDCFAFITHSNLNYPNSSELLIVEVDASL